MKESDLYQPVKTFLEAQGYEVKGEVGDCDVLARRGDEPPLIVELKPSLNLTVLLQVVERLTLSDRVYIGIYARSKSVRRQRRAILRLLRMLGLGLLLIEPESRRGAVEVLADPAPYQPRINKKGQARLLREFVTRVGDPNPGGMARRKGLMTAYRQRSLAIARLLETQGPSKASEVARMLMEPKARIMMYQNVYGWFERVSTGVYALSPRGREDLVRWSE